jgi:hypothetical protein
MQLVTTSGASLVDALVRAVDALLEQRHDDRLQPEQASAQGLGRRWSSLTMVKRWR